MLTSIVGGTVVELFEVVGARVRPEDFSEDAAIFEPMAARVRNSPDRRQPSTDEKKIKRRSALEAQSDGPS